jgi:hypothetical protein
MSNPKITAYVTAYALTMGIQKVEALHCVSTDENMIVYPFDVGHSFAHDNEWHFTAEEAVARAEEMREKKIASLKKQIAKLEKLEFKV